MLDVRCPKCKEALDIPEALMDAHVRCPYCNQKFMVHADRSIEILTVSPWKRIWARVTLNDWCFEGRATRREYWRRVLLAFIVTGAMLLILYWIMYLSITKSLVNLFCVCSVLLLSVLIVVENIILMLPVTIRRFHDRDMSGWWYLWFLLLSCIPFIGWIAGIVGLAILGCMDGLPGPNRYGEDPKGRPRGQQTFSTFFNRPSSVESNAVESVETRLSKLRGLRDSGVLSESEYEAQRRKIIGSL